MKDIMTTNKDDTAAPLPEANFEALNKKMDQLPKLWSVRNLFSTGVGCPPVDAFVPTLSFAFGTNVMVKTINPKAKIPFQANPGDAGFDLSSVEDLVLPPGKFTAVATGLSFAMEGNIELQIRPRSGLAAKHGITVLNSPGTIDSSYRGEVKVLLINYGDKPFEIKVGDRIAQGVFAFLPTIVLVEVAELPTSERGDGGFGSTGK
jgi:dUTP pyrophosphatase